MRASAILVGLLLAALAPGAAHAAPAQPAPGLRACHAGAALCGSVRVPFDRLAAARGDRINIHFELYGRKRAKQPSLGALVFMEGGPGYSSTASRDYYLELAGPLRERREVLLVDARGTGRSGALDCPELQSYQGDYATNARICAEQLGHDGTLYGSGNAAEDLVAVLDELGIGRVDLYGDSYGTFNAQTFAVRHPERVRSLVVDGAYPIAGLDPWYPDTTRAVVRAFEATCARSLASCPTRPEASDDALAALAAYLGAHPSSGTALDGDGVERSVEATVDTLLGVVAAADSQPLVYRELPAAGMALMAGDPAPFYRLVAETTWWSTGGSLREYSEAHLLAVSCHDYPQVFDMGLPLADRPAAFDAARFALPPDLFWPFPRDAWTASSFMAYDLCLSWPASLHDDPPLPAGRGYPDTPTLVLNGDLDQRTTSEGARRVAANFPRSSFVEVANVGHVTALGDLQDCASRLAREFWGDLRPPDASCASTAYAPVRLLWRFPRTLVDVSPAWAGDAGSDAARRAVQLAALTVADATWRWISAFGTEGVGLRGGTWAYEGDRVLDYQLDGLRLADDLAVSGTARWNRVTGAVRADLTVAGAVAGTLSLRWDDDAPGALASARGTLGGLAVRGDFPAP